MTLAWNQQKTGQPDTILGPNLINVTLKNRNLIYRFFTHVTLEQYYISADVSSDIISSFTEKYL